MTDPAPEHTGPDLGRGSVVVITDLALLRSHVAAAEAHIRAGGTVRLALDPIEQAGEK